MSRYLFYTNECVGLGHLRRAVNLARALAERAPDAASLIVTGATVGAASRLPVGVDTVKLPLIARDADGRHAPATLPVSYDHLSAVRRSLIAAAAESFAPDVIVVDKHPRGVDGELSETLLQARARGARLVLGLRDIEDDARRVRARWRRSDLVAFVEDAYDAIVVYGPAGSPSALTCLDTPPAVAVHHVGFVAGRPTVAPPADLPSGYVLVTPGGGADGFRLLEAYLAAIRLEPLGVASVIVTGPLMADGRVDELRALAAEADAFLFESRSDMEAVIGAARAVVAMAGYNTVAELLRAGKRALLVPRVRPSAEQLLRANALQVAGLADVLLPAELSGPALRPALERLLDPTRPTTRAFDADGAAGAAELFERLAAEAGLRTEAVA